MADWWDSIQKSPESPTLKQAPLADVLPITGKHDRDSPFYDEFFDVRKHSESERRMVLEESGIPVDRTDIEKVVHDLIHKVVELEVQQRAMMGEITRLRRSNRELVRKLTELSQETEK